LLALSSYIVLAIPTFCAQWLTFLQNLLKIHTLFDQHKVNNFVGSEDGKVTCGYSSYIGRRPTMEDCYAIKLTKVDGQPVNLFGVFDGTIFTLAFIASQLLGHHI